MSTPQQTLEQVIEVLRREVGTSDRIGADTPLAEDGLGLTSLGLTRAFIALEDTFGTDLDDAVLIAADLVTVGDMAALVDRSRHGS